MIVGYVNRLKIFHSRILISPLFSHYYLYFSRYVHVLLTLRLRRKIRSMPRCVCERARAHTHTHARTQHITHNTRHSFVYQEISKLVPLSCQDTTCMQQVTLTLTPKP